MNSSSTSLLSFFLATIIFGLVAPATADTDNGVCTPTADYCWSCSGDTTNATTTYEVNLKALLASLSLVNQTNYEFYHNSLGDGTNKVNAIAMCRGDIAENDCRSCYTAASVILSQNCSNQHQAVIWAINCTVRYSNMSIFGIEEDEPTKFVPSPNNTSNLEQFKQVLNPLLKTLSEKAASGDSMKKFAAGHELVPGTNQTIYAIVQCSPDLDKENCTGCLDDAISDISNSTIDGKDGGRILKPSCSFRFENNRFYDLAVDSLPPAPSPTQGNTTSITTKVSPSSFFQLLLSLLCISSALF
ncbi:hypothetical protein M0R45_035359 [Rubus argutus]|uniref:Gnk2-homologous domain-containing protein n=1 Tax=Rubus argutus TaxID=59490 RepID=A0AAW1VUK6_RUBAR